MKIFFHKYVLSQSSSVQGLLLKVILPSGEMGYANYHPHLQFGDKSIEEALSALAKNELFPQLHLNLTYARQDAQNRREKLDALAGAFLLENHFFAPTIKALDEQVLRDIKKSGFKYIKIKMGSDLDAEVAWLEKFCSLLGELGLVLRLDFNQKLSEKEFAKILQAHHKSWQSIIDFYEDPTLYNPESWQKWQSLYNAPLALDSFDLGEFKKFPGVKTLVLKPSRLNCVEFLKRQADPGAYRYVITHYMDHPVGMATAAAVALRLKFFLKDKIDVCGLLPPPHIQLEGWNIPVNGAHLVYPDGMGVGFSRNLSGLQWEFAGELKLEQ